MSGTEFEEGPCSVTESYQVQKVHIKNLDPNIDKVYTEKIVCEYFGQFGNIIDFKVLQKCELNRQGKNVCFHYSQ